VTPLLRKSIFYCVILSTALLPSVTYAQSQKTDIRPNAKQVIGDDIVKLFEDQTHDGSYNFNSEGVARNDYIESHTADGRVTYSEGDLKADGIWYVAGNNLCFVYEHGAKMNLTLTIGRLAVRLKAKHLIAILLLAKS